MSEGLIDSVLDLRNLPANPSSLFRFAEDVGYREGYQQAIDEALDILVPAMKKIAVMASVQGNNSMLPRDEVGRIIGHVPLKRTLKGWE